MKKGTELVEEIIKAEQADFDFEVIKATRTRISSLLKGIREHEESIERKRKRIVEISQDPEKWYVEYTS